MILSGFLIIHAYPALNFLRAIFVGPFTIDIHISIQNKDTI